jgi:exodeoxyribonuclease-5
MEWNEQQSNALRAVRAWLEDPNEQVFRLFGYAGTGKTTIAKYIAQLVEGSVCFAAYTGKAALVMRKNGCEGASTIHSLIYKLDDEDPRGQPLFRLDKTSRVRYASLVIIDECSMVNDDMAADLLSFGKKILVLGDPGQLPPVQGTGYFVNAEPDVMLTEIVRQAAGNPIIQLATQARLEAKIHVGAYGSSSVEHAREGLEQYLDADQVLVHTNRTRRQFIRDFRKHYGFRSPLPLEGERLICLRNNSKLGILNGEQFKVMSDARPGDKRGATTLLKVRSEDQEGVEEGFHLRAWTAPLHGADLPMSYHARKAHQELDYAYAMTVHKGQGSQWAKVAIYNEKADDPKWLYTAITRAIDSVRIIVP